MNTPTVAVSHSAPEFAEKDLSAGLVPRTERETKDALGEHTLLS